MRIRVCFLAVAALLAAAPAAPAAPPRPQDRRFFVKGYEVALKPDGSRWIGITGERRALELRPDGTVTFYESSGAVLGKGHWDAKSGALTGIDALGPRAGEIAAVVRETTDPATIVETGVEGDPLKPVPGASAKKSGGGSNVEFIDEK